MYKISLKTACLAMLLLIFLAGIGGCSSAECTVKYSSKDGSFEIVLNPPGETGEFKQNGQTKRAMHISKPPGGEATKVTTYEVDWERIYQTSGNKYHITGSVEFDNSNDKAKLVGYNISVTGGVYGDTAHNFTK